MSDLRWVHRPETDRPLMLLAFRGLFDAAQAATAAVSWLAEHYPQRAQPVAEIDPEPFFDFQQERPHVQIEDDGRRTITWPENNLVHIRADSDSDGILTPRDIVVCAGVEPHLRWRTFCGYLLDVARETNSEMVVTLGATVGIVPHTRPFPVTGSATNPQLAARLGLGSPSYEGPTGVVGALHEMFDRAGVPTISLRVAVPHYVPAPPNPKATRALLKRLQDVTRVRTGFLRFDTAANEWEARVNAAADEDEEVTTYVRKLERQFDSSEPFPSGDDIATELEAFLREQREG